MQYVIRAAWRLKPSPNRWFVQQLVKKTAKLPITGPLGWESTDDLFRPMTKKTTNPALLALCDGNLPMTGGFPSHRASNTESILMSWRFMLWVISPGVQVTFAADELSWWRQTGNFARWSSDTPHWLPRLPPVLSKHIVLDVVLQSVWLNLDLPGKWS